MRFKTFSLLSVVILLSACHPCARLAKKCPTSDSLVYIETIKENPSYTIPDSVYWQLEFECDSNYEVIMRSFEETNTGIETVVQIKKVFIQNPDNSTR